MIVAINGNRHQEAHFQDIERLVDAFLRRDDKVIMSDRFLDYLEDRIGGRFAIGIERVRLADKPQADLAIAIGGDGAFLKTAAWVGDSGIPVAGINTGHLGFLAAFSFDNPDDINRYLIAGDYVIEDRTMLEVETPAGVFHALNEAAITRGENAAKVSNRTQINGHDSRTNKGDGRIKATPTGSTAYNLSVGGPILDPSVAGWIIAPIAAHSLTVRPLVINDSSVVRLHVELRSPTFRLTLDGKSMSLPDGSLLSISKARWPLRLVTLPGHNFTDTLTTKMGLGN